MADIKFRAFVNDALTSSDGETWLLKTAETHRREKEDGSYETTARTFRDVRVSRDSGIDLGEFSEGDRVEVVGFETTIPSQKEGGETFYNLTVWASSVEKLEPAEAPAASKAPARKPAQGSGSRRR